ncbi:hypothetical protein RhiirC2_772464 [Rhizophagus irregularis]|uniref:Uncharacterized protein n=1 Tax=Rhizophagus irregularis TaxID=588596 RepID=A0A2N1NRM5_9GLOM|nr:hypothetical protein RhiirC2_772464 [Rhizophagus irregularis]
MGKALTEVIFANCNNFKGAYITDEVEEILSRTVPEDKRKLDNSDSGNENTPLKRHRSSTSTISSITSTSSITSMIKMCISNGLLFSFVENKETKALFNFIAPGLKLPD